MSLKPNGVIWNSNIISVPSGTVFYGSTYGNSLFVAVGSSSQNATPGDALVYTSSDGINYTSRISGITNTRLISVIWAQNKFVAVGYKTSSYPNNIEGVCITSSDGINWSPSTTLIGNFFRIESVTYHNSIFVAVGNEIVQGGVFGGVILTSSDGISWTLRLSRQSGPLRSVTTNNSVIVAVGEVSGQSNSAILTSTDGINWTPRQSGTTAILNDIIWTGSKFLVAAQSVILSSNDGINWSQISSTPLRNITNRKIAYNGKIYITSGFQSNVSTSLDSVSWTNRTTLKALDSKISYNNSIIVIPGRSGEILTSNSFDSISLNDIQNEFGGSNPISINEYYAGGIYVRTGQSGVNGAIPSSGQISLDKFYGSEKITTRVSVTRIISQSGSNVQVDVRTIPGYAAGYSNITVIINSGVVLTGNPALRIFGFSGADSLSIQNNGTISGGISYG